MQVIQGIAGMEGFTFVQVMNKFIVLKGFLLLGLLLSVEVSALRIEYGAAVLRSPAFRVVSFAMLLWLIALFGTFGSNAFIYFQF
jgi:hypothetical protein